MNADAVKKFLTQEGTLTWTMTTNGYKFYTLNLVVWLRDIAKVPWRLLIVCCDAESLSFFKREGIPCVGYKADTQKGQIRISDFGSDAFAKWNLKKLEIFKWLCTESETLGLRESLYVDGDIVIQKDPWPVLKGVEGGLAFQCDCSHTEAHLDCEAVCTGFVLCRHGQFNPDLFTVVKEDWIPADTDQGYIRKRLGKLGVAFRTLNRHQFGNGPWQKSGIWKTEPNVWVMLHYNYRVGDTKKAAMKTDGHWKIPY
jgi:hypothetical protein